MKRDRTEKEGRSTFSPEEAAAVHINCIRPVLGALEALIIGGEFASGSVGSEEAVSEMRKAKESLSDLSRHVSKAMEALEPKAEDLGRKLHDISWGLKKLEILRGVLK